MQQETRKATSADRQSQKAAEEQPSDHRNVNNVKTGQDTTRNAQVVRVRDKLQHGAARWEQVRKRRASGSWNRKEEVQRTNNDALLNYVVTPTGAVLGC